MKSSFLDPHNQQNIGLSALLRKLHLNEFSECPKPWSTTSWLISITLCQTKIWIGPNPGLPAGIKEDLKMAVSVCRQGWRFGSISTYLSWLKELCCHCSPLISLKYDIVEVLPSKMSHNMSLYTPAQPKLGTVESGCYQQTTRILMMTS